MDGTLYVVATPIGNMGDISLRALGLLRDTKIIIAEDSRKAHHLLSHHGIPSKDKQFLIYNDHSTDFDRIKILKLLSPQNHRRSNIVLLTDAGTPLISDPGYKLVKLLAEHGVCMSQIPGPCAAIAGLALSTMPTNRFMFCGFLPSSKNARRKVFTSLKQHPTTLIFFETAKRLCKTLQDLLYTLGNRKICVAREMTKIYEEYKRGEAQDVLAHYQLHEPKGEIVLVVTGNGNQTDTEQIQPYGILDALIESGVTPKQATSAILKAFPNLRLNKRELYQRSIKLKNTESLTNQPPNTSQ